MTRSKLAGARDYFEAVLKPAKERFFAEDANFQNLYAMINSLYHFHEWLWFYHSKLLKTQNPGVTTKGKYWESVVEKSVTDAGLIRDLNNVSKHVKLEIKLRSQGGPSRNALHAANTEITVTSSFGGGSVSPGSLGTQSVGVKESGKTIKLDTVAEDLYRFWESTIDSLEPPPSINLTNSPPSANA